MRFHFNFAQEWPIYVLIGIFLWFVLYLSVFSRMKGGGKDGDAGENRRGPGK